MKKVLRMDVDQVFIEEKNVGDYSLVDFVVELEFEFEDVMLILVLEVCVGMCFDVVLVCMFFEYLCSCLQVWFKDGYICLDGELCDFKYKVWGGEQVSIEEQLLFQDSVVQVEDIFFDIVFEDDIFIVINKLVGLVVYLGSGNWFGIMMNGLLYYVL